MSVGIYRMFFSARLCALFLPLRNQMNEPSDFCSRSQVGEGDKQQS